MSEARGAVLSAAGQPLELRRFPLPSLAAGEALVRVRLCTLCGSDLHTISGARSAPLPSILGHEAVGEVVAVGPAATCTVGQRVTWSIAASCGNCAACRAGREPKCAHLWKYGHERCTEASPLSGGLATHVHLRAGTTVVPLPDEVPDAVAAPLNCATATVAAALRIAGSVEDARVLVLGAGMLGLTASAMACAAGAAEVTIVEPNEERRSLATSFGANRVLASPSVLEPGCADVILELSGAPAAVEAAFALPAVGGRVVLVGSVAPRGMVPVDPEQLVRRLVRVEGVHNYRPMDLHAAVAFAAQHHDRFPFAALVAATYALDEVDRAVLHARDAVRVGVAPV